MNQFADDRGYSIFDIFPLKEGQINYSEINPGTIKAFHRHKKQTDYWICIEGSILVNLISENPKEIIRKILSDKIPEVLKIEPGIWHGYMALGNKPAKILYFVDKKFNPKKSDEERKGAFDFDNGFTNMWEIENK